MVDNAAHTRRRGSSTLLQRPGFLGAVARFWRNTYASDWIAIITLFVLYILIQIFVEPFHRMFSLDDLAIQYPHADPERVPPGWLLAYAAGVPLGVVTLWAIVFRPPLQKVHVTYIGLVYSVFMTGLLTDIIKNAVGRPRPDLLSRCKPAPGTPEHALVTIDVCTEPSHHLLHDGWRSFPSGHSSFAFSGLGYLALFLTGQLSAMRPHTPLPLAFLPLVPLVGALLIAISRTEDYRHDVWDVTTGSILGILVALVAYRRYYPSLWSSQCSVPRPGRGEPSGGRLRPKDDEAMLGSGDDADAEWDADAEESRALRGSM